MTWELVPSPFEFAKNQAQTLLENETWKWKQITYIRYVLAKLSKFVQFNTQTSSDSFLQRFFENWKRPGTGFQEIFFM